MSDKVLSSNFESDFITHPPRWFGRVVSKESWTGNIASEKFTDIKSPKGWGYRYKVRIFSWYTGNPNLIPDDQLPMANVILPTTAGSGLGGSGMTPSIEPGSIVTGFFMDGDGGQEPWIDGILGNSNNNAPKKQGTGPTSGYNIFNDTYKDGTNPSKVPDDRIIGSGKNKTPLSTIDALHIGTFCSADQKEDSIIDVPLLDASKKNNSPMKGVQKTISNLLITIQKLKKKFNEVSSLLGGVDFQGAIQKAIKAACKDLSGYIKSIIQGVKAFSFNKLDESVKKIAGNLFPSEMPKLYDKVNKGNDILSCVFKNIIGGLGKLICGVLEGLLDKNITTPSCAAQNFMDGILNSILGTVSGALSSILTPINALFGGVVSLGSNLLSTVESVASSASTILTSISSISEQVSGAFGQLNSIADSLGPLGAQIQGLGSQLGSALSSLSGLSLPNPNLLSALDFVQGIKKFFSCDTEQKPVPYSKITQDKQVTSGGEGLGLFGNISKIVGDIANLQSTIGGLAGSITGIVGQVQGLIGQGQGISSSLIGQITGLVDQFSGVMGQFEGLASSVSGSKSSSSCNTGPQPCGPPTVNIFGGGGYGAAANAIISPISKSVIGFDILNPGRGYISAPNIEIFDPCGKGSGASVQMNMVPDIDPVSGVVRTDENGNELMKIGDIVVTSPGDGYISAPDGSLGGDGYTWKEIDEGYVQTADGNYYVVQPDRPIAAKAGDTYYSPCEGNSARVLTEDEIITLSPCPTITPQPETVGTPYNVSLCLDSIEVLDGGFGYNPDDEIIITPDNGTVAKLVVNEEGAVQRINIEKSGCGFTDLPEIRTNSPTGFNATFAPVLKVYRTPPGTTSQSATPTAKDKVISVIDCVGKIPPKTTFDRVPQ
jgi:phage-related protein